MADVVLDHRQPTLRFPRSCHLEPGATAVFYWSGSQLEGDGVPGSDATINYARPLAGPLLVWLLGQPVPYGGGYGRGGYGTLGGRRDFTKGYGRGPYGVGGYGVGGGYISWTFPYLLRDGLYGVAVRLRDALGNEQAAAIGTVTFEIAALPRPATGARLKSYAAPILEIEWDHSPDVKPV